MATDIKKDEFWNISNFNKHAWNCFSIRSPVQVIWDGASLFWFHQGTGCCTVLSNSAFSGELTCGRMKKCNYRAETASKHIQSLSKYMVQKKKKIYIQTWNREEKKEHSSINKQLLQQLLLKLMVCFPVYHPPKYFGLCTTVLLKFNYKSQNLDHFNTAQMFLNICA